MASKAEQIIDHFTSDAALKAKILKAIAANKGKGKNIDNILAKFPLDAATTAKIKEIVQKIRAGHSHSAIAGYHIADPAKAARAAAAMSEHTGVVKHILQSN
jgi:hypothetical protein